VLARDWSATADERLRDAKAFVKAAAAERAKERTKTQGHKDKKNAAYAASQKEKKAKEAKKRAREDDDDDEEEEEEPKKKRGTKPGVRVKTDEEIAAGYEDRLQKRRDKRARAKASQPKQRGQ
jgi:hypothetical protein